MVPVSYTHLDVYKRQSYLSSTASIDTSAGFEKSSPNKIAWDDTFDPFGFNSATLKGFGSGHRRGKLYVYSRTELDLYIKLKIRSKKCQE